MFPFKFELNEAILDFYSKESKEITNEKTRELTKNTLFSYYLLFLTYENRTTILDYVMAINKTYYHITIPKGHDEYMSTLPKVLYNGQQFTKEDLALFDIVGVIDDPFGEFNTLTNHVVLYFQEYYPMHAVI